MQANQFNKRIFTLPTLWSSLTEALKFIPQLRKTAPEYRISESFQERIMLAVTQVNGCRYCQYGHAKAALQAGIPQEEIDQLAEGCFDNAPSQETPALFFAQHYAEMKGEPETEALKRLESTYGEEKSKVIQTYIRMIMMGNLYGNTFDAFLSRFKGNSAAGSSFFNEIGVLLGILPMLPAAALKNLFSRPERSLS